MGLNIFNIGKANAKIAELEAKIIELSGKPDESAPKLAEALASNESISKQLEQVSADLMTAQQTIAALEPISTEVAGIKTALSEALASLKIETKPDSAAVESIAALKTSVSDTLAKIGVPAASIPAPAVLNTLTSAPGESKTLSMGDFNSLSAASKMAFIKSGGKLTE